MQIQRAKAALKGEITVPGDKSITHRAVMIGSIAKGTTRVTHYLDGADCNSTMVCFRKMGIDISKNDKELLIKGLGLHGLKRPHSTLNCGNSGTTTRLISGILSGQSFESRLSGDDSIQLRPMKRILTPLRLMGASISSEKGNDCAPLNIKPSFLHGIDYESPIASAQVKSCILLAGLYADGMTTVTEPYLSRNHSELMLSSFGADVISKGCTATVNPGHELYAKDIEVPGDISSAAYFIAAALMVPGSEILLKNVGINPTRDGILRCAKRMGAKIKLTKRESSVGEETADILVRHTKLKGTTIEGAEIPTLIDEIPIIAVMASLADGQTVIKDAEELKVKESNRLDIMVRELKKMGVDITATKDGMIINGGTRLKGAVVDSRLDHRIAMSFAVAGLLTKEPTTIKRFNCVGISYPDFYKDLLSLIQ